MRQRRLAVSASALFILALTLISQSKQPSQALPVYARRYDVTCDTCHTVAPRLNSFGLAFQANHFNWIGGLPPAHESGLKLFPVSGLATFSQSHVEGEGTAPADFNTLEVFLSDGFRLGRQRQGGYFIDDVAAVNEARAGSLENAFVSLPVAGQRGQWSLTAGQFTTLMYQYDPINSLTQSLPAALAGSVDGFSLTDPNPGLRLDYFTNPGQPTADGDHLTLSVPFQGQLALNQDSRLYGANGVFAQAFRRRGPASVGVFGYSHASSHLEGLIGTYDLSRSLSLLGAGVEGDDSSGSARRLSLEANYTPNPQIALTARLEALDGGGQPSALYPVAALTYYPFHQSALRLTGETIQQPGSRSETIYALVQF